MLKDSDRGQVHIKKRSWEAKTEDKLQFMRLNLQKRVKCFEAPNAEPSNLKSQVSTNRGELGLKKNQLGWMKTEVTMCPHQEVLEIQSSELVSKYNKLGREQSKVVLDSLQKKLQSLNNEIMIHGKDLDLKFKELGEFETEIKEIANELSVVRKRFDKFSLDLDKGKFIFMKTVQQQPSSPILPGLCNPSESVLDLVQREIWNSELGLCESVMNKLLLLLEELTKLRPFNEPQLQLRAQELAILWKQKIKLKAPGSSALEVLAFLHFVVAYGLKKLINQEETALLASSISHYKQAPILFHALGLEFFIPDFVIMLLRRQQYTPAVRLICEFKLKYFSPLQLLKEEILALKHSVMENRQYPPQDEDKYVGKLRALLELVADYNLEIDIPGDLIVKLMVQREGNQIKSHLKL